jgi:hypothetical protein
MSIVAEKERKMSFGIIHEMIPVLLVRESMFGTRLVSSLPPAADQTQSVHINFNRFN